MLDTDLCIRVLRDRPAHLRGRFNAEADGLVISTIVLMELLHGAATSQRPGETRRSVDEFVARLTIIAFDDRAARHAADIKAVLERKGSVIGAYDIQIAGHARSEALTLITGNLREFRRVDGLMSEDWA